MSRKHSATETVEAFLGADALRVYRETYRLLQGVALKDDGSLDTLADVVTGIRGKTSEGIKKLVKTGYLSQEGAYRVARAYDEAQRVLRAEVEHHHTFSGKAAGHLLHKRQGKRRPVVDPLFSFLAYALYIDLKQHGAGSSNLIADFFEENGFFPQSENEEIGDNKTGKKEKSSWTFNTVTDRINAVSKNPKLFHILAYSFYTAVNVNGSNFAGNYQGALSTFLNLVNE